jgi:hypothetical protein
MFDLILVLAFIGVVVTPAVFAARSDTKAPNERAPKGMGSEIGQAESARTA